MARSFMKVYASIWGDPEFRRLSRGGQLLYVLLGSQARLTLAGVLDLMPARWAHLSEATTATDILDALNELASARFVVVDWDTEEVVIRSHVRYDLEPHRLNINLIKGLWAAWSGIMSSSLRKVVVDNLPEIVWEKSGTSAPDEAQRMRRSPRLQLPVETTGSDQPSEPTVETGSQDDRSEPPLSAVPCPSPAAAEREPRGMTTPGEPAAAVDNSPGRLTDDERLQRLAVAVDLLVDRELTRNPTRNGNPKRHAEAVRKGKLKDHHLAGHRLLVERPDLTPQTLADLLEPPPSTTTRPVGVYEEQQRAQRQRAEAGMHQVRETLAVEPADDNHVQAALARARQHVAHPDAEAEARADG